MSTTAVDGDLPDARVGGMDGGGQLMTTPQQLVVDQTAFDLLSSVASVSWVAG